MGTQRRAGVNLKGCPLTHRGGGGKFGEGGGSRHPAVDFSEFQDPSQLPTARKLGRKSKCSAKKKSSGSATGVGERKRRGFARNRKEKVKKRQLKNPFHKGGSQGATVRRYWTDRFAGSGRGGEKKRRPSRMARGPDRLGCNRRKRERKGGCEKG